METLQGELDNEFTGKTVTITPSADNKEWTIKVDNVEETVPAGKDDTPQVATLPTGVGTTPYFPKTDGTWHQVDGTTLTNGLVITDEVDENENSIGNEYVWIEVPNSNQEGTPTFGPDYASQGLTTAKITESTITDEQKTKIESALWSYTNSLITRSTTVNTNPDDNAKKTTTMGWIDEWYDGSGKNALNTTNTSDTTGCGLTENAYNTLYKEMLKSVYNNGGFWIGRYEAGIETARNASGDIATDLKPLSKQNVYPLNYVTCNQAQILATRVENVSSEYNRSLMYGIQWDCVLKYLQNKGVSISDLTLNSSSWGNYSDTSLTNTISNAKEFTFMTNSWGDVVNNTRSNYGGPVLSSTGALVGTDKKNIYDLAGNVFEWTLERSAENNGYTPCSGRGGYFNASGYSCSYRFSQQTSNSMNFGRIPCLHILNLSNV